MKRKWFWPVLTCGMAVVAIGITAGQESKGASMLKVPAGWTFTFPDGDAETGQVVFMEMECHSCHAIKIPGEKIPAGAGRIGPGLTEYSTLPKAYLAESIIKVHTVVAAPGYVMKGGQAGMGKYNHFLTVQELIDLVAFLKHGHR